MRKGKNLTFPEDQDSSYIAALESDQIFMDKEYSEEATKLTSIMNRLSYLHCVSHNSTRQLFRSSFIFSLFLSHILLPIPIAMLNQ